MQMLLSNYINRESYLTIPGAFRERYFKLESLASVQTEANSHYFLKMVLRHRLLW